MVLKIKQPEPIGRQVFRELQRAILTLDLSPGLTLSVQEIASQMGVSRQPVREAFIKLAEAGLVKVMPQRGTYVRKISIQEVLGARFNREAIETAVAKEILQTLDQSGLDQLQGLIDKQEGAAKADNWLGFMRYDDQFHKEICVLAGRARAWEVLEADKGQMDRVRYLCPGCVDPMEFVAEHQAILDALAKRDEAVVEQAIKIHLSGIKQLLPTIAQKYPNFFEASDEEADS